MSPRAYNSIRRDRAAADTRTAILDAALDLFFRTGYNSTTIAEIARQAEVGPNTVYVSVGGKPQLVLALIQRGIEDPTIGGTMATVADLDDAREVLRVLIDGIRENYENVYEIIAVMYEAARSDSSLSEAVTGLESYYRANLERTVERLLALNALKPGIEAPKAVDILWFYLGLTSWRVLRDREWSWAESADWLTDEVTRALLK